MRLTAAFIFIFRNMMLCNCLGYVPVIQIFSTVYDHNCEKRQVRLYFAKNGVHELFRPTIIIKQS